MLDVRRVLRDPAGRWRAALTAVTTVVVLAAGVATWDVARAAREPSVEGRVVDVSSAESDPRRQVLVSITVTSDAPFFFGYVDAEGEDVEEVSPDGRPITVELVRRGDGPYVSLLAQTAPNGTFVRCRIEVNGQERADETGDGGSAQAFCSV